MKLNDTLIIPALLLAPLLTSTSHAQEEQVFQARFNNITGANTDFATNGWSSMILDPQVDPVKPVDGSMLDTSPPVVVTGISGDVGVELCFCEEDNGLVFIWSGAKTTWHAITHSFDLDRSQMEVTRITWNHDTSHDFVHELRIMIKIAGEWFATATVYNSENEELKSWKPEEHLFTTTGSDWLQMTAELDVKLELGEPVSGDLPSGNIEAIGFYVYHPASDGSIRIDELAVYAEPSDGGGGEPDMWGPYEIVKQGERDWVDTAPWMGWLDVTASPWIYSLSMDGWVYIDSEAAGVEAGAWVYVLR